MRFIRENLKVYVFGHHLLERKLKILCLWASIFGATTETYMYLICLEFVIRRGQKDHLEAVEASSGSKSEKPEPAPGT